MADYSQGPIGGQPPQPEQQYNTSPPRPAAGQKQNEFMSQERPEYPRWITFLLIPALVLGLGVLGMMAYVAHALGSGSESIGFNIFAAVWGLIVTTYIFLALVTIPKINYKWIVFILAVISCIWWLVAFAWLASNTRTLFQLIELADSYSSFYGSDFSDIYGSYGDYSSYFNTLSSRLVKRQYGSYLNGLLKTIRTSARVMAGAAAMGAIIWVLWVVFTAFYAIALFRSVKKSGPDAESHVMGPAPVYEQKTNISPQPQQQLGGYPAPPGPIASPVSAFSPIKPDPAYDPRQQGHFMTPPPPQQTPSPAPYQNPAPYANPQFSQPQQAYEMPTPITSAHAQTHAPVAAPHDAVEMPAGRQ